MAKRKDTIEAKVLAILEEAGAVVNDIDRKNHLKIKWSYRGHKKIIIVAQIASDHRAEKNALAHVRQDLQEIDNA